VLQGITCQSLLTKVNLPLKRGGGGGGGGSCGGATL